MSSMIGWATTPSRSPTRSTAIDQQYAALLLHVLHQSYCSAKKPGTSLLIEWPSEDADIAMTPPHALDLRRERAVVGCEIELNALCNLVLRRRAAFRIHRLVGRACASGTLRSVRARVQRRARRIAIPGRRHSANAWRTATSHPRRARTRRACRHANRYPARRVRHS